MMQRDDDLSEPKIEGIVHMRNLVANLSPSTVLLVINSFLPGIGKKLTVQRGVTTEMFNVSGLIRALSPIADAVMIGQVAICLLLLLFGHPAGVLKRERFELFVNLGVKSSEIDQRISTSRSDRVRIFGHLLPKVVIEIR